MSIARQVLRGLLVSGAALSAVSAAHAVSASATIDWSAMNLTLEDTAPDDGIAASIRFASSSTNGLSCDVPGPCDVVGPSFADMVTAASTPLAGATWNGTVAFDADRLSSSIGGTAPTTGEFTLMATRGLEMWVSGASRVTLSVPFTLSVDDVGGSATNGSFAMAVFGLDGATTTYYISSPWDGHTTYSGLLSVSANLVDDTSTWIGATTWASLQGSPVLPLVAAPVPEPASVAMMLAGVGVVGFAARRRRRVTPT